MGSDVQRRRSVKLSWLLRHGANETRLPMDAAGWASIDDVLRVLQITREQLQQAVEENTKSRLQVDGARIRACQGHSLEGCPVTLDALEASWTRIDDDAHCFHGTNVDAASSIVRQGIHAASRTHVHLARAIDSKVGKRHEVDVMLTVAPALLRAAGIGLFCSPNGVLLARSVPRSCIVDVVGVTPEGLAAVDRLKAALHAR